MPKQPETGDAANPPRRLADDTPINCYGCERQFDDYAAYRAHDCPAE